MLEAAQQRLEEGQDVVVGYIDTHSRPETEIKLKKLEVIPNRVVNFRDGFIVEMDLDGILKRRPGLVLIDELAHNNAPSSRHPKRYQDIQEILDAGSDVYTTVDIQYFESLNDIVRQITGIVVTDTIPDSLLDTADEIELVDLPVDELIHRMREGKVFLPGAIRAVPSEVLYRKGNLTALRELTLRRAAERVNVQMRDYMNRKEIQGPWPAAERVLVCVSSHPLGERLVRAGRRLSDDLNAEWYVIFVETPGHTYMKPYQRDRLEKTLQLAEKLGAHIRQLNGSSVAETVLQFSHEHNITKIIVGKQLWPRWLEMLRGSVTEDIIRRAGGIDVYIVSEEDARPLRAFSISLRPQSSLDRYLAGAAMVGGVTMMAFLAHTFLHPSNLVMLFLFAVVFSAMLLGRGPAMLASLLSVVVYDFFFVEPRLTFSVADSQYLITFAGLILVGLIISNLGARLSNQVDILRRARREHHRHLFPQPRADRRFLDSKTS